MTTTIASPAVPVGAVRSTDKDTHPAWCDLTCDGGCHRSVGTMLPLGAAHVTTALSHDDDFNRKTGADDATTRLHLTVEDVEVVGIFGEVYLEPEDARLLADVLTRYARQCESARRLDDLRMTAAELRADRFAQ